MLGENLVVANFHIQEGLLFHVGHLYVPLSEKEKIIWESHYNQVERPFRIENIVIVL
jgi:hypothetical protein